MPIKKPRKLPELLADRDNSPLSGVIRRGRQLHGLGVLLGKILGPELAAHCQLANIRGNTLVVTASSTAWATRVRYQSPQLLQKIRCEERFRGIDTIHVRITPLTSPLARTSQPIRRASMSGAASECLSQCAEGVEDQNLRSALQHLAKRKRPGDTT
jgi:hypothetical protein